ncbi:efflux RND transporter permease subunit [Segatella albensis]|uniref:efflux RND transporter permease subunit n=1 Tax=Segatella albensis TaxID=77768 RepID=UPI000415F538|nr:efflux RND transporter permease subunit [Segatella albensis]
MFKIFIRRPVLAIVVSLVIVFIGIISLFNLPVTQYPSISPPKVNVTASYPGANNELTIKSVVIPLEQALNGVPGMKYIESDAGNDGEASINVVFKLGTDPNVDAINVQNRVSAATNKLPPEVIKEGVRISREEPNILMYINLYSDDPKADQEFLFNYFDINISPELQRVDGVGDLDILGTRSFAMRVWLKPDKMTAYGLSADDIADALEDQNIEVSPGRIGESSGMVPQAKEYVLKYSGRYTTPEEYGNIVVKSNSDGQMVRLKDVADIHLGSEVYDIYSTLNGRPSAAVTLKQAYGSNARDVITQVKKTMERLKKDMPKGMHYEISYDISRFLNASISKVIHTLFEAFLLVAIVVFVFLGDWRSSLIPVLAVPVSLLGSFAVMLFFNITLNMISLFALVMAIGIVVDDAIVVIEAVNVKIAREHLAPLEATQAAMKEISGAIIAISLVMASVFIPVAFMGGPEGMFYRQFSIVMASSILLSGFVALTLTPALCALILTKEQERHVQKGTIGRFLAKFNRGFNKGSDKYQSLLQHTIKHKAWTMTAILAFCVLAFLIDKNLPSGFIPQEDQGMIYAEIQTPPGSTIERTNQVALQVMRIAEREEGVESVSSLAGFEILSEGTSANTGSCLINLRDWKDRKRTAKEIMDDLEKKCKQITQADINFFEPPSIPGYGSTSGFELRLLDKSGKNDYHEMERVSKEFVDAVNKRPEIGRAFSFYSASYPQYMLKMDDDMALQKGVAPGKALNNLATLVGSDYETGFIRFGKPYKVLVQAAPQYRAFPEDLLKLNAKNDQGEMVPYADFMTLQKTYGMSEITRHNLYNSAEVTGLPASGYSSGQAIKAIDEVAAQTLPRGYDYDWAGISKDEVAQGNTAIIIFIICLGFVYLILAGQYENFILPLPIITCLPAGIFGAFLFLKASGLENNIYAQIALVMLIGLLGKNAVLMVEYAVQRKNMGMSIREAAIEGAVARFRPILMTSIAFVVGLLPLVFTSGAGAVGNHTIGTAAIGGMLVGTLCGLLLIPSLYDIFANLTDKIVHYQREKPLSEQKDKSYNHKKVNHED